MGQLLKLCTGESLHQVLWHTALSRDIRQVDFGGSGAGELDLSFLGSFLQALHGHRVLAQVDALVLLEAVDEPIDDHLVEVITSQVGITVCGEHLEHAVAKVEDGDIKCTATEVEHGNLHVLSGFVHAIGEGGSCRLIHNTANVETGDGTGFLGGLALRVGEVGRYGNHGVGHFLPEIVLSGFLHLLQNHGRDFLRGILTASDLHTGITVVVHHCEGYALSLFTALLIGLTHETLDGVYGVLRVGDGLTLCRVTHLALTVLYEANYRRCCTLAFRVSNHYRLIAFENSNAAVGST